MTEAISSSVTSVTVVIVTRNRRDSVLVTLDHLSELPEHPPIIVVDNGSSDGTGEAIHRRYPAVVLIQTGRNHGVAGRNEGVERAQTPYVAFSDDDSWWAPGALARAWVLLDAHPGLGLIAARILVGPDEHIDPTCTLMARSPLVHRNPVHPGVAVLGFLACGAIVRRKAFLQVGGFCDRFGIGGEEELVSIDLADAGWDLAYVHDVIAHHHPSPRYDGDRRYREVIRNALWTAWLRRSIPAAVRRTGQLVHRSGRRSLPALGRALLGLPWALANRRVISPHVDASLDLLAREEGCFNPNTTKRSLRSDP